MALWVSSPPAFYLVERRFEEKHPAVGQKTQRFVSSGLKTWEIQNVSMLTRPLLNKISSRHENTGLFCFVNIKQRACFATTFLSKSPHLKSIWLHLSVQVSTVQGGEDWGGDGERGDSEKVAKSWLTSTLTLSTFDEGPSTILRRFANFFVVERKNWIINNSPTHSSLSRTVLRFAKFDHLLYVLIWAHPLGTTQVSYDRTYVPIPHHISVLVHFSFSKLNI